MSGILAIFEIGGEETAEAILLKRRKSAECAECHERIEAGEIYVHFPKGSTAAVARHVECFHSGIERELLRNGFVKRS